MNLDARYSPPASVDAPAEGGRAAAEHCAPPGTRRWRDPMLWGTVLGLGSAVGYTAANVCLRAVSDQDPIWVSCVKSMPTVALFAPWLLVRRSRGERVLPPRRSLLALVGAALLCHIGGNVCFQWSLGVIGIAMAVPLTLGSIIVSGAVMGRIFLGESLTVRMLVSILILTAAMIVLGWGAAHGARSPAAPLTALAGVAAGVLAACVSGIAYAVLGVVIRHGVKGRVSVTTTLVIVSLVGVLSLGGLSWFSVGVQGMLGTPSPSLAMMLLAGICNAAAFLALTHSLQLATVTYINALNSTQVAMATVAGVVLFAEPITAWLIVGIALTVTGLVTMKDRTGARRPE